MLRPVKKTELVEQDRTMYQNLGSEVGSNSEHFGPKIRTLPKNVINYYLSIALIFYGLGYQNSDNLRIRYY